MAPKLMLVLASMMAIAAPGPAAGQDRDQGAGAPAAGPDAKYCMRVEPVTGSRIESIQCWTRAEWAELEVDVDEEWAREGVSVIA